MKKSEDVYREHLLGSTIPDKIELIKKKTELGYPMHIFCKPGNGIKTLLNSTGRLTDFKGIFVITSLKRNHLVLGDSTCVISEIQKLSRAQREGDKKVLKKLAIHFDCSDYTEGQRILNTATVNWLEIADKTERVLLKRALQAMPLFIT